MSTSHPAGQGNQSPDPVHIELLVIPDCPNARAAEQLVRAVLRDVGLSAVQVRRTVIDDPAVAECRRFTGSPTVLINGVDPFAEPRRPSAIACRIYPGTGGLPSAGRLRQALETLLSSR